MTDETPAEAPPGAVGNENPPAAPETEAPVAKTEDELTVAELAQAVLERTIRPRAAGIRRLAQAVVDLTDKSPAKKKKKGKPAKKDGKKRKLARIPGQKSKKA